MSATETVWPVRTRTRERNREALLAAAGELLASGGYRQSSVGEIAKRAGLTTGAVYSIFGSKAELFLELLRERSQVPSFDNVTSACPDMASALEAYGRLWARLVNDPDARRMLDVSYELQVDALRSPALRATVTQIYARERTQFAEQLEATARRRSERLPVAASELAASVMAALQGLAEGAVLLGQPADEEMFGAVARRLLGP